MNFVKNTNPSKWQGKTWSVIGDSITEHNFRTNLNYHDYIKNKIGCRVNNYGVSGTGWRTPSSFGGTNAIYQRLASIDASSDLITVFAGTNDWGEVGTIMNLGVMGDTTTTSLYGAIDNVLSTLIANFPTKAIAVFTPLKRADGWYNLSHTTSVPWVASTANSVNNIVTPTTANGHVYKCTVAGTTGTTEPIWTTTAGGTVSDGTVTWQEIGSNNSNTSMQQIADAIIAVCNKYAIPVLDLYRQASPLAPWNTTNNNTYFKDPRGDAADGLHPNDAGHKVLADKILSFLNTL